jgi:primosomal protein N' (replication factor Y)
MNTASGQYGLFAVANATAHELTYEIPEEMLAQMLPGVLCELPVQGRRAVGVFLSICSKPSFTCRPVAGLVPDCPALKPRVLELVQWLSHYYLSPLGRSIHLAAPGFVWNAAAHAKRLKRQERAAAKKERSIAPSAPKPQPLKTLNPEQSNVRDDLRALDPGHTALLQGVTGSGKTEVYLHLVRDALDAGGRALILLPEIALTPQMCERFRVHFPEELAVLHSGLSNAEHEREWFRVARGEARVVLGVRSAVFAPVEDLRLIVVDEEHEQSYKCDEFPCYHARDVAVKRAQLENARCILGSATPSLESYLNAERGKYKKVMLRAKHSRQTNRVEIFQYRPKIHSTGGLARGIVRSSQFSFQGHVMAPGVVELLRETHSRGEQSMVILNRRGFAQFALCGDCGTALQCPHCSVSTTLHARGSKELCHYCGFSRPTLKHCPSCGSEKLVQMGLGTQNMEQELTERIPGLVVDRLDRDVLTSTSRLSEIINRFRTGETQCLVGTQMLSKGHDFPRVTLVVILNVEDGLFVPDFRASERTFQLLCQASGRTGRGELPGLIAVQSLGASHPVVSLALEGNVERFLADELKMRQLGWHPPVCRQVLIEMQHSSEAHLMQLGLLLQKELASAWTTLGLTPQNVRLTGPLPAVLSKLRGQYRVHLVIAAQRDVHPSKLFPQELMFRKEFQNLLKVDVDPFSFL